MTRHNEVIRVEHIEKSKAITFSAYMTIMAVLEEEFQGLKRIIKHPLFKRRVYQKKDTALMDAIRKQLPVSLSEVQLYHDTIAEKYPKEISVPSNTRKVKRFRTLPGMNVDHTRGQKQTDVEHHIQTFEKVSDRAGVLLNKLFS